MGHKNAAFRAITHYFCHILVAHFARIALYIAVAQRAVAAHAKQPKERAAAFLLDFRRVLGRYKCKYCVVPARFDIGRTASPKNLCILKYERQEIYIVRLAALFILDKMPYAVHDVKAVVAHEQHKELSERKMMPSEDISINKNLHSFMW